MAAIRWPGTEWVIWLTRPRPMKPAPIMPTRIGFPCASRALSALSMMITCSSAASSDGHLALEPVRPGLQQRRHLVLVRNHRHRQGPREAQPRVVVAQRPLVGRAVELPHLVAGLGLVLQHLVAVGEAFGD